MEKRIVVIGGGPGGYSAAIRAAQLGAKVFLAENVKLGGTCLNIGCVPTKTLLHSSGFYRRAAGNMLEGIKFSGIYLDWPAVQRHKVLTVERLTGGINALLRHNGVKVYNEKAYLLSGKKVRIGTETLEADAVILASGSVNTTPEIPGIGLPGVIDSTAALSLEQVPESVIIVGGGVIGVEFAGLFNDIGTAVTIIEAQPELLPSADCEIAELLHTALEERGITVHCGASITGVEQDGECLAVNVRVNGELQRITADKVLVAAGRKPYTAGLGLENIGVKTSRGAVVTDECFRTNVEGLYAVGDCNGKQMLAHAAMAQGIFAAEHICRLDPALINTKTVPGCVYTSPEIAYVGMSEKQVKEAGIAYKVGRFSLEGNAKAIIDGGSGGLIKIIADRDLGEILGVHMIGSHVTEIIGEAALCIGMEGTAEDIVNTVHGHPTVSESLCEAAMSVFGKPIHGI